MPHGCDKVTLTLQRGLQDSEAIVRVVKCHSFDASDQGFRDTIHARIEAHVLENPMDVLC